MSPRLIGMQESPIKGKYRVFTTTTDPGTARKHGKRFMASEERRNRRLSSRASRRRTEKVKLAHEHEQYVPVDTFDAATVPSPE